MTMHIHHPKPQERVEFLVDGCPRCEEYVNDLGLHFDSARWRAFWAKMVKVEFDDEGHWVSALDKKLGRQLYHVALGMQRAFGIDPHVLPLGASLIRGISDNVLAGVPRLTLEELIERAGLARTALDDPEALPEGAVPAAYYEGLALGSGEGFRSFAMEQLDAIINNLRLFVQE